MSSRDLSSRDSHAGEPAPRISPLAAIDPRASIDATAEIGPFCVIGPDVTIGAGTRLLNHVTVLGKVTIGCHNVIHANVVIGGEPQDLSYRGSPTRVEIGDHNVFREGVTINRATEKEDGVTVVGSHCYMMACSHVAHDCHVGNHVILANAVLLGGHVHVRDHAALSGGVAVHHYTTIGSFSFVGGLSRVLQDVPPYLLVEGSPSRPRCVNIVALKRNGFSPQVISGLSDAHRLVFRSKVGLDQARETLGAEDKLWPEVQAMLDFIDHQQDGRFGRGREKRRAA